MLITVPATIRSNVLKDRSTSASKDNDTATAHSTTIAFIIPDMILSFIATPTGCVSVRNVLTGLWTIRIKSHQFRIGEELSPRASKIVVVIWISRAYVADFAAGWVNNAPCS